ncbi:hypothetical protein ACSQ67_001459 [Phaseolus vulgaris]
MMMYEGGALSPSPIEGEASVGKFSKTYQRRPKLKGPMEFEAPNSHPRRFARLHAKISQAGSSIRSSKVCPLRLCPMGILTTVTNGCLYPTRWWNRQNSGRSVIG